MNGRYRNAIGAGVVALSLAGLPGIARAQIDCSTFPVGPSRTDCYINVSRGAGLQSDIAAGQARVQSDAARYRQVVGTSPSKTQKGRRKNIAAPPG
jgi:hypothetical protein